MVATKNGGPVDIHRVYTFTIKHLYPETTTYLLVCFKMYLGDFLSGPGQWPSCGSS